MIREDFFSELWKRERIREHLGDLVGLRFHRGLVFSLKKISRTAPFLYNAGREFALASFKSEERISLQEAIREIKEIFEKEKVGIVEIIEMGNENCKIAVRESATAHGVRAGERVCHFIAGFVAGYVEARTGLEVDVRETRCAAEGNERCEFEIFGSEASFAKFLAGEL